jgi:hypothetical protein
VSFLKFLEISFSDFSKNFKVLINDVGQKFIKGNLLLNCEYVFLNETSLETKKIVSNLTECVSLCLSEKNCTHFTHDSAHDGDEICFLMYDKVLSRDSFRNTLSNMTCGILKANIETV